MKLILGSVLSLFFLFDASASSVPAQSHSISFHVQHQHRIGHCEGVLRIDGNGIAYQSSHRGHARVWPFKDVRHIEILSTTGLAIYTYGKPGIVQFRLREGELTEDAYQLLLERVERGVTSRVLFPATSPLYELPVKHRHRFGGCEGVLRINSTGIVYDTVNVRDKRMWRTGDVRSFGTAGPYNLRLTTERETFNFDLKEALKQEVYDHLWKAVYKL